MQNLNSIPIVGKFTDAASAANTNFAAVKLAIDQLELTTSRSKGFFTSALALTSKYPSPVVGDWAIVQVTENNVTQNIIYKCSTRGTWSNSGTEWAGGSVDLTEYLKKGTGDVEVKPTSSNWVTGMAVYEAMSRFVRIMKSTSTPSSFTTQRPYVNSSGKYAEPTSNYSCYYISNERTIAERGRYMKVYPQSGKYVRFAFTKNQPVTGQTAVYSEEYPSWFGSDDLTDQALYVQVPSDAEYILFQWMRGGENIKPTLVEFYEHVTSEGIDEKIEDLRSELDQTNSTLALADTSLTRLEATANSPFEVEEPYLGYSQYYSMSTSSTIWGTNNTYRHKKLYVADVDYVEITAAAEQYCMGCWLTDASAAKAGGDMALAEGTAVSVLASAGKTVVLKVPADAKTLALYYGHKDTTPFRPASVKLLRLASKTVAAAQQPVEQSMEVITTGGFYITSGNNSHVSQDSSSEGYKGYACKLYAGETYLVEYAKTGYNAYRSFLTQLPHNNLPAEGTNIGVTAGTYRFYLTPETTGYFFIYQIGGSPTLTVTRVKASNVQAAIDGLRKTIDVKGLQFNTVELSGLSRYSYSINEYGWYATDSSYKHLRIAVSPGMYIKIIANSTNNARYAFLASSASSASGVQADLVPGTSINYVSKDTEELVRIPEGTVYLYVYAGKNDAFLPSFVGREEQSGGGGSMSAADKFDSQQNSIADEIAAFSLGNALRPLEAASGWEEPTTVQQLNAVKKADQLIKLKWTPKADIPGKDTYVYPAGQQVTKGVPYSSNMDDMKHVGIEVSIHTFMTAVNNPYSLLYTEDIGEASSQSAWGKTYHSTNGRTYYGTVCCGFTSAVVGQVVKYHNSVHPKLARTDRRFVPLYNQGVEDLRIGDIADNPSSTHPHSYMIYGIRRDANGVIDRIRVAESSSGSSAGSYRYGCGYYEKTPAALLEYNKTGLSGGVFVFYRPADFYKNIDYQPSPFVPLTDRGETETAVVYNNDICTFAGDKACFMQGDLVVLNYALNGNSSYNWTAIKLYKGDTLMATYNLAAIDQSELPAGQQGHALKLGTELEAGSYKACVTDGSHDSDYTYFEVLSASITIVNVGDGSYKIKANGNSPMVFVYVGLIQASGRFWASYCGREPTFSEVEKNEMTLFPARLRESWGLDGSVSDHIRVVLKGEYGHATTQPILLPDYNG